MQHLAGLILFSFIVGTSMFVSSIFSTGETSVSHNIREYTSVSKKKCKKKKRRHHHRMKRFRDFEKTSLNISVAEFSRETDLLKTSIDEASILSRKGKINLHFFSSDRNGVRFLKSASMHSMNRFEESFHEMEWLGRLDPDQDVYLMADFGYGDSSWSEPPAFDYSRAVQVSIKNK